MERLKCVLLFVILAALGVLFFLTYPSIGSVMIGVIMLAILIMLVWQRFLNQ